MQSTGRKARRLGLVCLFNTVVRYVPSIDKSLSPQLRMQDNAWYNSVGIWAGLAAVLAVHIQKTDDKSIACCDAKSNKISDPSPIIYRASEVAKHNTKDAGIWVTYKSGVYDITTFVANHPGGTDKIMLAAGSNIEPFWKLYTQHTSSALATQILESLRIGDLHADDVKAAETAAAATALTEGDPYKKDPIANPLQITHVLYPRNAEAPKALLAESWITGPGLFFVRNHHPVPQIDPRTVDRYEIQVQLNNTPGATSAIPCTLTLADLKNNYKKVSIVSTIQCGGNRRAEMNSCGKTFGCPWEAQAISTAEWTGAKLCEVLRDMGVTMESAEQNGIKHVVMIGAEDMQASIPISKALDPYGDTLLAYKMNGEDIPPSHGYPLRMIVPGVVGVRNVKWLKKIILSKEEAVGQWQRGIAYKGFGPSITSVEGIEVEAIPSLQQQPVQSAITVPTQGASFTPGEAVSVKGYAYSGGGRGIVRVDVSSDGGKSWKTATLTDGKEQPLDRAWAWTLWEAEVTLPKSVAKINAQSNEKTTVELICKATDASYNVQPDSIKGIWNLRGINNNAWHRVNVVLDEPSEE